MKLVQILNEKLRQPTAKEIDDFLEYRANHVALVQRLGQLAFDMDFSDHDYDKITSRGRDFDLMVLRNASKTSNLKLSDEDKNELRKISAKHAKSQKHHPEYWDDEITIRNFQADDTNVIHATRMPYRWIAEMACDWAAVILYKNEDLFAWYNKVIDNTLIMTDGQKEFLAECLILLGKIITKENIKYPGREYNAKLEEASLYGVQQFASDKNLNSEDLEKLLRRKIEKDWNLDIKRDRSSFRSLELDVAPRSADRNAPKQVAASFKDLETRDKEVREAPEIDLSSTPTAQITLKPTEEIPRPLGFQITFKPSTSSGASPYYVPAQEAMWCWFILCKINHKENRMPKNLDEVTNFDWKNTFNYNVDFTFPKEWYTVFDKGSDAVLPYLDPSKEYVGFREDTPIDVFTTGYARLPGVHNSVNRVCTFANIQDRNNWNPSDIYLVRKDKVKEINQTALTLAVKGDVAGMNEFLKQGLINKTCVGISLKKEVKDFTVHEVNMGDVSKAPETNGLFSVKAIEFPPMDLSKSNAIVTVNTDDGILEFQIAGGRVTTALKKRDAREGSNNLESIFKEYSVPSDTESILDILSKAQGPSIFYGNKALRGYDLINSWNAMQRIAKKRRLNNKEFETRKAWNYMIRVACLLSIAYSKDKTVVEVLKKIRKVCSKKSGDHAPYLQI